MNYLPAHKILSLLFFWSTGDRVSLKNLCLNFEWGITSLRWETEKNENVYYTLIKKKKTYKEGKLRTFTSPFASPTTITPRYFWLLQFKRYVFSRRDQVLPGWYGHRPEVTYFPKHKIDSKYSSMWNFQIFMPQYLTRIETNKKYEISTHNLNTSESLWNDHESQYTI